MLPRLLVLDDLFGRDLSGRRNVDRENLCAHFLWRDVTGDEATHASRQRVLRPTAEVVFARAQTPACSGVGDVVENDLHSALASVRGGWVLSPSARADGIRPRWTMVLLDLCFYTGPVTEESDLRSPGMPEGRAADDDPTMYFGLTLLDVIHREFPALPIFILSSKPREEVSLEFSRRGALGFIDRSDMRGPQLLAQALWNHGLMPDPEGELIGNSLSVLLALREGRRAAGHRENVLIRGERGAGKELIARFIQRAKASRPDASGRVARSGPVGDRSPFVTVNSAVFTPNLFASELFGIQPKTATGVDGKVGLIQMAHGGDLFLDEIADMPPEVQAAMLRVLQERQIARVGGRQTIPVDVRFLSATNKTLEDAEERFRPDLLDRLRLGGTIWLPPLRDRPDDIPLLADDIIRKAEAARPDTRRRDITDEALQALLSYSWPGNVRELRSVLFEAVSRFPDVEHLVPKHLSLIASSTSESAAPDDVVGTPAAERLTAATGDRVKGVSSGSSARAVTFPDVLHVISSFQFATDSPSAWAGKFGDLQTAQSWLAARMLLAALETTKRRTPERPDGEIRIHPAAKLLTGDPRITASQAADLIKRMLGPIANDLDGNLLEAYTTAVRLRPKVSRSSGA